MTAMSNDSGYKILKGTPPPRAMIDAAKAEISADNLQKIQNSTSNLGFEALGWGADCDKLLHYGLDVSALYLCVIETADMAARR